MTANKRFTVEHIIFDGYCIVDNTDGGYYAYDEQDLKNDSSENDNDNADSVMGDGRMVQKLYDDNMNKIDVARHPDNIYYLYLDTDIKVSEYSMIKIVERKGDRND